MFRPIALAWTDGYKLGHKLMLAEGTTKLYGTWIPRNFKRAPKGIEKIISIGHQKVWRWIHDQFVNNFFNLSIDEAQRFVRRISLYLGQDFDGQHFYDLHKLGYLPIKVKALPEGLMTGPNIPHMTFVNTVDGYAWLTLYLETIVSALAWKMPTAASIAALYYTTAYDWLMKTDKSAIESGLIEFLCHDFSARGLSPDTMIDVGLGHASVFTGSDTLITMEAAEYYYDEHEESCVIGSVPASEHSVSTTKIFTVGEQQMISDWMKKFPKGVLSIVADTFDLWKLITEYLPNLKAEIMSRDGKLVIRPDSGDPVDIICGLNTTEEFKQGLTYLGKESQLKGVIELLWDIFGGTTTPEGYKVLDSHIGCIYGDSITLERQTEIYERLAEKGFAASNIVFGVGSFTYQYNTRDTFGFAAKGSWFETQPNDTDNDNNCERCVNSKCYCKKSYNIYKDPVTDDGTKRSLKGLLCVSRHNGPDNELFKEGEIYVIQECSKAGEDKGLLQTIYEDGKFMNQCTFNDIRKRIKSQLIK